MRPLICPCGGIGRRTRLALGRFAARPATVRVRIPSGAPTTHPARRAQRCIPQSAPVGYQSALRNLINRQIGPLPSSAVVVNSGGRMQHEHAPRHSCGLWRPQRGPCQSGLCPDLSPNQRCVWQVGWCPWVFVVSWRRLLHFQYSLLAHHSQIRKLRVGSVVLVENHDGGVGCLSAMVLP